MARRILIHAGFHKTGTTTLQDTFGINSPILTPHLEMYLRSGVLLDLLSWAVLNFSANRNRGAKDLIVKEAHSLFSALDMSDPRPIFLSSESLVGHFVGAGGVQRYAAAPIAMELIKQVWHDVTDRVDTFEVYYSTRRNDWLASCHWQRLKNNRMSMELAEFEQRFADAADLDKIVDDARTRMPDIKIHDVAIEDTGHPIDPVLEILGLAHLRDKMEIPINSNSFPGGDARDQLLALNRSDAQDLEYRKARNAIVAGKTIKAG